jgi:hypothetical protein
LEGDHLVIRMSFEGREDYFASLFALVTGICRSMADRLESATKPMLDLWQRPVDETLPLEDLRARVRDFCEMADKPVVVMIDEVDRASDFTIFSAFLGLLREMYLERDEMGTPTFQSVILAGVHDIKNLRKKIRPEERHSYNSPWNIAADFDVDLSFSASEIETMLRSYEDDHATGMDIPAIANRIYYYTSGYPFLVSRLCKTIDEKPLVWSTQSVDEAVKRLLWEKNTLFDDMIKNILGNEGFGELLKDLLLHATEISFDPEVPDIALGSLYGILVNKNGKVAVSNIIFETRVTNFFLTLREQEEARRGETDDDSPFIRDGRLDMDTVVDRFSAFMHSEYRDEDGDFIERQMRLLFLSFVRPIINGTGNYAVEPQTRGNRRMDVVIFLGGEELIVELKIWRGPQAAEAAYHQLTGYLKSRGQTKGWLISFADNKKQPRESRVFEHDGCMINETVIAYRDKE